MVTIIVKLEQNGSCQAKCGLRDDLAAHMSEYLSFKELVNMAPLWEGPVVKLEKNTGIRQGSTCGTQVGGLTPPVVGVSMQEVELDLLLPLRVRLSVQWGHLQRALSTVPSTESTKESCLGPGPQPPASAKPAKRRPLGPGLWAE